MKPCDHCGKNNPYDYNFCMRCGQSLIMHAMVSATDTTSTPDASRLSPLLQRDALPPNRPGPRITSEKSKTQGALLTKCPFCAEEVSAEAKKCKHCGEFIGISSSAGAAFSGINRLWGQWRYRRSRDRKTLTGAFSEPSRPPGPTSRLTVSQSKTAVCLSLLETWCARFVPDLELYLSCERRLLVHSRASQNTSETPSSGAN